MIVHAHIIAWNESKILPFTLDHYSQFCDKIIVYDNMSTDNSDEIYAQYDKVEVVKWETEDKKYNDLTLANLKSNIYKFSRKYNADWVIVCDCDEFLYHENLLEKLQEYKEKGVTLPKTYGYNMFSETFPEYDGELLTNKIKYGSEILPLMSKFIIFNPTLEIKYSSGAHSIICKGATLSDLHELKLLHYKFLGKEYTCERYKNLATQLSEWNIKNNLSLHWTLSPVEYIDVMLKEKKKII